MKNFISLGNNVDIAAPYAVTSGQGVLIGALFGVAAFDADNGAELVISTVGVYDLAKWNTAVFTVGAPVYFDVATKSARSGESEDSNSAGDNEALIGVAVAAAGVGQTTVRVKLGNPVGLV